MPDTELPVLVVAMSYHDRHAAMFQRVEAACASERSGPRGWIQWKGTDVCMDVYCECGVHTHIDTDFCYSLTCGSCGRTYHVSGNVRLVLAEGDELVGAIEPKVTEL